MAIALDVFNKGASDAQTTTVNLTVGNNTNRILIVIVTIGNTTGSSQVASVKWNTTETFTAIAGSMVDDGDDAACEAFYLLNPTTGAHSVVVDYLGSTSPDAAVNVWSLYNVDQSDPIGAVDTITYTGWGSGGAINNSITTETANSWAIQGISYSNNGTVPTFSPASSQNERNDAIGGSGAGDFANGAFDKLCSSSGSNAMNLTDTNASDDFGCQVIVEVKAAATGTNVNDTRAAKITGYDVANSSRPAKITGTPYINSLSDNFNDNSIDTAKWDETEGGGSTLSETNQQIEIALPASATASDYNSLVTDIYYNLLAGSVCVEAKQVFNTATAADMTLMCWIDSTHWVRFVEEAGTLYYQYKNGGGITTVDSDVYNSTTHRWWKIREVSGTIYWDVSEDGGNWTNVASLVSSMNFGAVFVFLEGYAYQAETNAGTCIFDNLNITPPASSTRAAKITGKDVSNSTRAAKITGRYVTPQYLYWTKINSESFNILAVEVRERIVTKPATTSIDWHVSANGGANWEAVTAGTAHTIVNAGNDLRLRATLNASTDGQSSPSLDRISITWTEDQGGGAASTRSAKITGKDVSSSTRAAKITGQDTSNSTRAAKITGQAGASDTRAAKIHGVDTSFSIRSAKITGGIIETSERAAKITGVAGANATRAAKITGKDTANSTRAAKITGTAVVSDQRSAKITGFATTNSERAAKITGGIIVNDSRAAKITGQDLTNSTRSAKITGVDTTNSTRNAKITGKDTSFAIRAAKITGFVPTTDERAAKITGAYYADDERDAKITGKDTSNSTRAAKIIGKAATNSERSAKVTGKDTASDTRSAKIHGKDTTNSTRAAKIIGGVASERAAKIIGKFEWTKEPKPDTGDIWTKEAKPDTGDIWTKEEKPIEY